MGDQDRTVLIRFFVGLVAVIVIIVLAWLIFFRDSSDNKKTDSQTSKSSTSQTAKSSADSKATAKQNTSQNAGQSSTTPQSSGTNTGNQNSTKELTKTGPEHTVAVFLVAVVLGTAGHVFYRRKAFARVSSAHMPQDL